MAFHKFRSQYPIISIEWNVILTSLPCQVTVNCVLTFLMSYLCKTKLENGISRLISETA